MIYGLAWLACLPHAGKAQRTPAVATSSATLQARVRPARSVATRTRARPHSPKPEPHGADDPSAFEAHSRRAGRFIPAEAERADDARRTEIGTRADRFVGLVSPDPHHAQNVDSGPGGSAANDGWEP